MIDHRSTVRARWVASAAVGMVSALGVAFLLGMYINLFVSLPTPPTAAFGPMGGMMMGMPGMTPVVMLHALWGVGLAITSLMVFVGALATRWPPLVAAAAGGFLAILMAGWAGLRFLLAGQHNAMSYTMAVGWLVAVLAYVAVARGTLAR